MRFDDFIGWATLLVIFGFMVGIVLLIIFSFTGLHLDTGSGTHTGYVTAVERSGVFWKTGTAYFKTEGSSSQEDLYCVTDNNVYAQLEQASKEKRLVTIEHKSYFMTSVAECNNEPAIIYGIK